MPLLHFSFSCAFWPAIFRPLAEIASRIILLSPATPASIRDIIASSHALLALILLFSFSHSARASRHAAFYCHRSDMRAHTPVSQVCPSAAPYADFRRAPFSAPQRRHAEGDFITLSPPAIRLIFRPLPLPAASQMPPRYSFRFRYASAAIYAPRLPPRACRTPLMLPSHMPADFRRTAAPMMPPSICQRHDIFASAYAPPP